MMPKGPRVFTLTRFPTATSVRSTRTLTEAMAIGGAEAQRAFTAMMSMRKIDVAAIDVARRG